MGKDMECAWKLETYDIVHPYKQLFLHSVCGLLSDNTITGMNTITSVGTSSNWASSWTTGSNPSVISTIACASGIVAVPRARSWPRQSGMVRE
jgi:hypothetical protein